MTRTWGRSTNPENALARLAGHIEDAHPQDAERLTAAAAVSAAQQGATQVPHKLDHTKHDHAIAVGLNGPHPHPAGHPQHIRQIARRMFEEAKAAGYDVAHFGLLTDGEHVELHHLPMQEGQSVA
jgi:hypothetical protein